MPRTQVIAWLTLIACAAALIVAIWPRGNRGAVRPDAVPRKRTTEAIQDLTQGVIDTARKNPPPIRTIWRTLRIAIVAMAVTALAWGSILDFR